MATKKSTSKKPIVKATAVKKAAVRKAPVKRATAVRTKKVSNVETAWDLPSGGQFQSFKVGKVRNFFSVRITDQTVYWSILCFLVLALGVWVVTIDDKVQRLYDQIDAKSAEDVTILPLNTTSR